MDRLTHTVDLTGSEWIGSTTAAADWGTVAGWLPSGYEASVRFRNPCSDPDTPEGDEYVITPAAWATLAQTIEECHGPGGAITAGLWTGHGWIARPGVMPSGVGIAVSQRRSWVPGARTLRRWRALHPSAAESARLHDEAVERGSISTFDLDIRAAPLLELLHREYALFTGTTSTLLDPTWPVRSGWPELWGDTVEIAWPADRSWIVRSDTDLVHSYVACSAELAQALADGPLRATPVRADEQLS